MAVMLYILREVFPVFQKWRYVTQTKREQIGQSVTQTKREQIGQSGSLLCLFFKNSPGQRLCKLLLFFFIHCLSVNSSLSCTFHILIISFEFNYKNNWNQTLWTCCLSCPLPKLLNLS
jgi:choline-glycine betaine transporter